MIIGASLGSFKGQSSEEGMRTYLGLSREFNIKAVELRLGKDESRQSFSVGEKNKDLANFLANFEVRGAHLPFINLNPISIDQRVRRESLNQLIKAITQAAGLDMSYVVMHARGFNNSLSHAQQLEEWVKTIAKLVSHAASQRMLLTIENSDFLGNLEELVTVVKQLNSDWLKITLDTGHAHVRRIKQHGRLLPYPIDGLLLKALDMAFLPFITCKYMPYEEYGSIKEFLKTEIDIIANLHLHDHNGRQDHLSIGSGKIDFSFLRMVTELPLIIEAELRNHCQDFKDNYDQIINITRQR